MQPNTSNEPDVAEYYLSDGDGLAIFTTTPILTRIGFWIELVLFMCIPIGLVYNICNSFERCRGHGK